MAPKRYELNEAKRQRIGPLLAGISPMHHYRAIATVAVRRGEAPIEL